MQKRFEWDAGKAESNLQKHGVSFGLATRAFTDQFALVAQDRIENGELRWQTLGMVDSYLLLLVVHTIFDEASDGAEAIRIISARRADPRERKRYEENYSRSI